MKKIKRIIIKLFPCNWESASGYNNETLIIEETKFQFKSKPERASFEFEDKEYDMIIRFKNARYRNLYTLICIEIEKVLNSKEQVYGLDIGYIDFSVIYEDDTESKLSVNTDPTHYFSLFRLLESLVPPFLEKPYFCISNVEEETEEED